MAARSIGGNCLCWRIHGTLIEGRFPDEGEAVTPFYHSSRLLPAEIVDLACTIEAWAWDNEGGLLPAHSQHEEGGVYGGVMVEVGPTPTDNLARYLIQVEEYDHLMEHLFPKQEYGTSDAGITTRLFEQSAKFEERIIEARAYRPQKRYFVLDFNGNKQLFRVEDKLTGQQADAIGAAACEIAVEERVGFRLVSETDQFDRPELWQGCVSQAALWEEPPFPEGAKIAGTTLLDAACSFATNSSLGHRINEMIDTLMAKMGVSFQPVPRQRDMVTDMLEDFAEEEPTWDGESLTLGDATLLTLAPRAKNLRGILATFQEEEWPDRIDDPLPGGNADPGQRLRDAVKSLNDKQSEIAFSSDGTGEGVRWRWRSSCVEDKTPGTPPERP